MNNANKSINELIEELNYRCNASISDYYLLLGFKSKFTFLQYLKRNKYPIMYDFPKIKIDKRSGKDYRINASDMIILIKKFAANNRKSDESYLDYLYEKLYKETFIFQDTREQNHKNNLGCSVYDVKGVFYNYSLNTIELSKKIGICPYECYKIGNKNINISTYKRNISRNSGIPYICFDSVEAECRNDFLFLLDIIPNEIKLSKTQQITLQAYKMAITELLRYQDKIIMETEQTKKVKETAKEKKLKGIYREASKRFHPDVNKSEAATKIMQQINHFYDKKDFHAIKNLMEKTSCTL